MTFTTKRCEAPNNELDIGLADLAEVNLPMLDEPN